MKKKIIIAVLALLLAIGGFIAYDYTLYRTDDTDTEEAFRQNVAAVGYDNTIEEAIPQTELYNIIYEHFRSPLKEGNTQKKAIVIGYDGCRADILTEIQEGSSGIEALVKHGASFKLSYCGGVNYPETNTQDTSTAPGWCSVLTGKWADEHGITGNDITKTMDTKTLLTSLTEDEVIGSAAFITKWAGHFDRENATYLDEKKYCEDNGLAVDFVKCKNDDETFSYTRDEIAKDECADFIFTILEHTDSEGHGKGFTHNNPGYKEAFTESDLLAESLLDTISARKNIAEEEWLIIITSDHGGIGTNHGKESIQERMTFTVTDYWDY